MRVITAMAIKLTLSLVEDRLERSFRLLCESDGVPGTHLEITPAT